jgi:acyl-CoA thioesterase-1
MRMQKGTKLLRLLASGACVLLLLGGGARAASPCDAPDDLTGDIAPLPHVAAALKPNGTLNVLTVGSATVFGPSESLQPGTITGQALGLGANKPGAVPATPADTAFPLQMAQDLRTAIPGLDVEITVRGGRGMQASDMLDIIRAQLKATHYDLVIWQTGTVEAVRNVPTGSFYQTLSDGSALIAASGADLVLVDPQFTRFLHATADIDPYSQTLREIAAHPGAVLFHRFNLMRFWSTEGQIDMERTPRAQRLKTVEQLHACLGQALARFVTASANDAK